MVASSVETMPFAKYSLLLLFALLLQSAPAQGRSQASLPSIYLWVWRYNADMTWIDSRDYGVAYLAGSIRVGRNGPHVFPRLNSLSMPDGTHVEAVVRIEVDKDARLDDNLSKMLAEKILSLIALNSIRALQIDFDALKSQRLFYRKLLFTLKESLPESVALKMTALASWVSYDCFSDGLPVQDVVPMFFRMGRDRQSMLKYLRTTDRLGNLDSIGLCVDEPDVLDAIEKNKTFAISSLKRIYIFSPGGWSARSAKQFAKMMNLRQSRRPQVSGSRNGQLSGK
ncbi:MAG: DUF3142 domain-containing protein [Candidatus Obscuribacterales bacterium]|nr:DUF3142 domain-containing protein [Candidatus Obscuribacterales bacterium]